MNEPRVPDSVQIDILEIRNKHTLETVPFESIQYEYASKKDEKIWCMKMDGIHLSKHKPYLITYLCQYCKSKVQVGITQFLRKIQKPQMNRCRYCYNQDEEKCYNHSLLLKGKPCTIEVPPKLSINEQRHLYETAFYQELDSDEQNAYFTYHLTLEEYQRLKSHIVAIYQGRIRDEAFQRLEYIPIWKCSNQMRYSSRLYDPLNETLEKPSQIQCRCETCDGVFNIKDLHSLKNKYKVLCQECSLCRSTFKKRPLMNIHNERVLVQSKLETKFVKWCQQHDIRVLNGPKLKYVWNEAEHTYNVDFQLPELNWIVEIKDIHIWHRQQMENGKWDAKYRSATEQVSQGTYDRFITIFPKNWMRMTNLILSKRAEKI